MADEVTYDAPTIGGYGYMEEYPMAHELRDSRLGQLRRNFEILKEIIARLSTKKNNINQQHRF
jgi:alkylation response protein AidB-like acyl-CoA dehydrogenase